MTQRTIEISTPKLFSKPPAVAVIASDFAGISTSQVQSKLNQVLGPVKHAVNNKSMNMTPDLSFNAVLSTCLTMNLLRKMTINKTIHLTC